MTVAEVRIDLAIPDNSTNNTQIADNYVRAETKYGENTDAVEAYVRILTLRQLKSAAANLVDYEQNESSEKLDQLYKHLDDLILDYEKDLEEAIALYGTNSLVLITGMQSPIHIVELPDDYGHDRTNVNQSDLSRFE